MKSTKPIYWLLLPFLVIFSVSSIWGTIHFFPNKNPNSQSQIQECSELKKFILSEEVSGKTSWVTYHSDVLKYQTGLSDKTHTIALVKTLASEAIAVLQSDLRIYEEMAAHTECLTSDFKTQLSAVTTDTQSSIDFLLGQGEISGQMFDPNSGVWNSAFYDTYESAIKYLK